jgi:hypothetical protein|tara:strand:+ start:1262 stop:1501 length:240 start_codon:yes stop_codon:yes gene_type:complete
MTREEEEERYELGLESLEISIHAELAEITQLANKTEIEHLRQMHSIGQSLIDFAQARSREIQNELCEIAGPEISKRNRG